MEHTQPSGPVAPRYATEVALVLIAAGIALRLFVYAVNRSLWIDEAMLAINIVNRSFPDLMKPLEYNQGAPLGFLFLEKAVLLAFGNRDYVLRLVPLLAGIASVPLMYAVARRYVSGWAPVVALSFFSFSPSAVYYSSEAKQYSTDLFVTLCLFLLASNYLGERAERRSVRAIGVAAAAIWMSHPSVFVLAAIGLVLFVNGLHRGDSRAVGMTLAVGAFLAVNLALLYFISLRSIAANSSLLEYWHDSFMPMPPWTNIPWFYTALRNLFREPGGFSAPKLPTALLFLGVLSLLSKRRQVGLLLTMPFLFALAASALHKYPFNGRLLLFLTPLIFLLMAEGIETLRLLLNGLRPSAGVAAVFLSSYLLYEPVLDASRSVLTPFRGEDIKPVMRYVSEHRQDSDGIYLYYSAVPAFDYYARFYGLGKNAYVRGGKHRADPEQYVAEIDQLRGKHRVWFVFSHNCTWCRVNEEMFFLKHLNDVGEKRDQFLSSGASAYLYDFDRPGNVIELR